MTTIQIKKMLRLHLLWLRGESGGQHAKLIDKDLSGANLRYANLSRAFLKNVNLSGADLGKATLRGAKLVDVALCDADLDCANLYNARCINSNFRQAYLRSANLDGAYLENGTVFVGADLTFARLFNADLFDSDLTGACLDKADLRYARLHKATMPQGFDASDEAIALSIVPSTGSFTAWKRVKDYLVKLRIPANAKRSNGTGRKCRASYAKVESIFRVSTGEKMPDSLKDVASFDYGPHTPYIVGQIVRPDEWDPCRWNECSHGIHFFMTRHEAENW